MYVIVSVWMGYDCVVSRAGGLTRVMVGVV